MPRARVRRHRTHYARARAVGITGACRAAADAGRVVGAVGGGPVRVRAGRGGEGAHARLIGRAGCRRGGVRVEVQRTRRVLVTPTRTP